jgi:acyl carrier protein
MPKINKNRAEVFMADLKDSIRTYIQAQVLRGRKITNDTRIITNGWVNSLEMVSVKSFLEAQYQIEIPDKMATREAFDSVNSIAQLLGRLGIR